MPFYHYTIMSLRRSGCHPIGQWVGSLLGPVVQYCNMGGNRVSNIIENGRMIAVPKDADYPMDTPIVVGLENANLDVSSFGVPSTRRVINVRDPFNLCAASLTHNAEKRSFSPGNFNDFVRKWIDYVEEFAGYTNFINAVGINFNEWNLSHDYRKAKAAELGFPDADVDIGIRWVSGHGGGSSFDRTKENKEGGVAPEDRAKRNERWREVLDREEFQRLLDVPMIWKLSDEIWPDIAQAVRDETGKG